MVKLECFHFPLTKYNLWKWNNNNDHLQMQPLPPTISWRALAAAACCCSISPTPRISAAATSPTPTWLSHLLELISLFHKRYKWRCIGPGILAATGGPVRALGGGSGQLRTTSCALSAISSTSRPSEAAPYRFKSLVLLLCSSYRHCQH